MANQITFGIKPVSGAIYQIKVLRATRGKWPNARTIKAIRKHILRITNKHGKRAVRIAKQPGFAPRLSGDLVRSIRWINAKGGVTTSKVIKGSLAVGVPYGRRQEFEHKTRGKYLERAMEMIIPKFTADLQKKNVLEGIIFGRRRQIGGPTVRGGFF